MSSAAEKRRECLKALLREPLDLLIIGGGIVGAGIARDAAMRGLRTGLVEQHDFAFGTSSRSSRLLHGGLRYLAQGRLGLVHQGSTEKTIIHHIAPHLAEPLPFIFPAYRENREWVLWQLKIGVKIYDLLCHGRNFGPSTWLDKAEVLDKVPGLNAAGLTGAVRYFDAFTNDARLTLDTLRSAARHGAMILNYCSFKNARRTGVWECEVEDRIANERHVVRAATVVNATGPWADGLPHSHVKLRLTKGIHLVVDREKLFVPEAVVMTEGKRVLFAIPWGERTILGTTDTDYSGPLDDVSVDPSDVDYVLRIANQFFPGANLMVPDVVSSWAGLRPLLADPHGRPSELSRSHRISNPEPGWWDVAGGKLTTYRLIAEETVDGIVGARKDSTGYPACRTTMEPLLLPGDEHRFSGVLPPAFNRAAVEHYCKNEWARHLEDVMIRRTNWHYYLRDAVQRAAQVATWMGELLGWTEDEAALELRRYADLADGNNPLKVAARF